MKLVHIAKKMANSLTEDDIKLIYENIKLKSESRNGLMHIYGNESGILYLTIFLLDIVKNGKPDHFHFDEFNGMEKDSIELIFESLDI